MRIGEVIGSVTLNRVHPSLAAATFRLAIPLTLAELADDAPPQGDTLVVYDELGAGNGSRIAISEGGEAAQPFFPDVKPVDAYNAALLDLVQIRIKTGNNEPEDLENA
ncbi:MAG: carbon dioxide concentrating mechanism protein CcmL [Planctomycetota bacterium]|nr:MAG: carbon dioxide concentrating mechanism protein CcmL [Planctomycetota bacterium]